MRLSSFAVVTVTVTEISRNPEVGCCKCKISQFLYNSGEFTVVNFNIQTIYLSNLRETSSTNMMPSYADLDSWD